MAAHRKGAGEKIFLLASPSPSPPPPPDQSTVWGVWCEVWGPVFGHRAAWLPRDDAPAIFATRDEAEAEAERLNLDFGSNSRAEFRCSAKLIEGKNIRFEYRYAKGHNERFATFWSSTLKAIG